ncbi:unnamed protein product [Sphagnum troendelagicum]|uniref:Ras-related protein n=1 Tax=Sphagnum troendelagicum TaxID=128251 RepID=A0ABP0UHQ4_9BRYO
MLVGNKRDLAHIREVAVEEGTALAEQHNMSFIETSALESMNVIIAFQTVLREIHKIVSRKALAADWSKNNTVLSSGQKLAGSDDMTPRRGGCCLMSVINLFDRQNTSSHSISEIAEIIAIEADRGMLHLIWDPYIEALVRRVLAATFEGIEPALDPKASSQESMVLLLHGTPVTDVAARVA